MRIRIRCAMLALLPGIVAIPTLVDAQAPDTLWTRAYGGDSGDEAFSVQQTSDGGFILAGMTRSFGSGFEDAWLVRTDDAGDTLWTRTYGGTSHDEAYAIVETTDGGFVATGHRGTGGGDDVWLIRTDSLGDALWTKTYGGSSGDRGYSVEQTFDGGFVVCGYTRSFGSGSSDVWLLRTDASGDTLWTKAIGGDDGDQGFFALQLPDSGFMAAGTTTSFGEPGSGQNIYLVRTASSGDTLWTRTYDVEGLDGCYSGDRTSDGGFAMVGVANATENADLLLLRTDADGDTLWTRRYDRSSSDWGWSVRETSDGGFVLGGYTKTGEYADAWLLRTDAAGDTLWTATYGVVSQVERLNSVQQTADAGYVLAGAGGPDYQGDFWLIRVAPKASATPDEPGSAFRPILFQNHPNPFQPGTTIRYSLPSASRVTLKVYDLSGRRLRTLVDGFRSPGIHAVEFDRGNLADGVYYYRLETEGSVLAREMLILK